MSWFNRVLGCFAGDAQIVRLATLAAAIERLEDRRLLSVSCAPVTWCPPKPCVEIIYARGGKNCAPVRCDNGPIGVFGGGKDCAPQYNPCKPACDDSPAPNFFNGGGKDSDCERGEKSKKSKRCDSRSKKDDCRSEKECRSDNDCDNGPFVRNSSKKSKNSERCESDKKSKKSERCESKSKKDNCRRDDECELPAWLCGGNDNYCQPDPCQIPTFRGGGKFCEKTCEPRCEPVSRCEPKCEPVRDCGQQQSNRSGKNGDCNSKPSYGCKPTFCDVPLPA